jgi:2-polyprenyl-3-methyl-5-hydroxy-6-metoxy-1,4-benzoquinol methylase
MTRIANPNPTVVGTGGSALVERCQVSGSSDLRSILFLGYLPPVNTMSPIGSRPGEQPAYPAELLYCPGSRLVQLGLIVDPQIIFPPSYAYTSGTTRILRENFAELQSEVAARFPMASDDLIVDIGSNDGTLLGNFLRAGHRVCGVEPTDACRIATAAGIPTVNAFFNSGTAGDVRRQYGKAKLVTATNVFAHIEDVHDAMEGILRIMEDDGLFVSESHYLVSLLETLQYDTIYHEHLRYYSLSSLSYLLGMHGLEPVHGVAKVARTASRYGGAMGVGAAGDARGNARGDECIEQRSNMRLTIVVKGK